MNFLILIPFFSILYFVTGCGSASTSTGLGSTINKNVKATAPNVTAISRLLRYTKPSPALLTGRGDTWQAGSGNYGLFNLMRDYDDSIHNGVLDMSNMYKALYEMKLKVDGQESTCTGSNAFTEKTVTAPFTGFSTSYAYTCGMNSQTLSDSYAGGYAMKSASGVYNLLYGFQWAGNANGGSVGVVQAKVDTTSNSLAYEMVNCVNCGGGTASSLTVRTDIQGNPNAHTFTIRSIVRTASSSTSIAGKGTSQGTGAFMLFKFYNGSTTKYYCLASNATEADFRAATGSVSVPSDCSSLSTNVDALTLFKSSDAPFALSDFTGSTTLLTL